MLHAALRTIVGRFAASTPPEDAVPADRPSQIALLRATPQFARIAFDELTDLQLFLAVLVWRQLTVLTAEQRTEDHDGHREPALWLTVARDRTRRPWLTLVTRPCGATGLPMLRA